MTAVARRRIAMEGAGAVIVMGLVVCRRRVATVVFPGASPQSAAVSMVIRGHGHGRMSRTDGAACDGQAPRRVGDNRPYTRTDVFATVAPSRSNTGLRGATPSD